MPGLRSLPSPHAPPHAVLRCALLRSPALARGRAPALAAAPAPACPRNPSCPPGGPARCGCKAGSAGQGHQHPVGCNVAVGGLHRAGTAAPSACTSVALPSSQSRRGSRSGCQPHRLLAQAATPHFPTHTRCCQGVPLDSFTPPMPSLCNLKAPSHAQQTSRTGPAPAQPHLLPRSSSLPEERREESISRRSRTPSGASAARPPSAAAGGSSSASAGRSRFHSRDLRAGARCVCGERSCEGTAEVHV